MPVSEEPVEEFSTAVAVVPASIPLPESKNDSLRYIDTCVHTLLEKAFMRRTLPRMMVGEHQTELALAQLCPPELKSMELSERRNGTDKVLIEEAGGGVNALAEVSDYRGGEVDDSAVKAKDSTKGPFSVASARINVRPRRIVPPPSPSYPADGTGNKYDTYDPQSAATRYSAILHNYPYDPDIGVHNTEALLNILKAYDWNSICALDSAMVVRARLAFESVTQLEKDVLRAGWVSGSIMPRAKPFTQLAFLRYLARLPFSKIIVVSLTRQEEDENPERCHPAYADAITAAPIDINDVLYDNTTKASGNDERWKAYHEEVKRLTEMKLKRVRGADVGRIGLSLAAEQIMTVPHASQDGNEDKKIEANGVCQGGGPIPSLVRAPVRKLSECSAEIRGGYLGTKPIVHLHYLNWGDGGGLGVQEKVGLMRLILEYLIPGSGMARIMKGATDGEDVGMLVHCRGGVERSGTIYLALRYLDSIIHNRDPLKVSDLEPKLPAKGQEHLPSHQDVDSVYKQEETIQPCGPLAEIGETPEAFEFKSVFEAAAHLIPMIRLIDQAQQYRPCMPRDAQRMILYDLVEIVMLYGIEGLVSIEAWKGQDLSVWATAEVEGKDGRRFRPWRSVRIERRRDKISVKVVKKDLKMLEKDARAWLVQTETAMDQTGVDPEQSTPATKAG